MMDDIEKELERIQGIALQHAVDEMDEAAARTLATKEDRGDRGFLTGMAAKSLGVAVRIEQFLMLRRREGFDARDPDDPTAEANAKMAMVKKARGEVAKIMERVGAASKTGR